MSKPFLKTMPGSDYEYHACPDKKGGGEPSLYHQKGTLSPWALRFLTGSMTNIVYCPYCGIRLPKTAVERLAFEGQG